MRQSRLDVRIMAHPSRKEMVLNLLEQLDMTGDIVIWDDRENGGDAIYTAEKAWRSPLSSLDVTHRVVLQDDVIVSQNFLKICNDIINTVPNAPISLYNTFIDTSPIYKARKCCYFRTYMMGGPGILMPVKYINPCWDWINKQRGTDTYCKCDDTMITRYMNTHNIIAYTTIPSIVQHISDTQHQSLITAFGELKYLGDRVSTTFRDDPQDDFTVFVPQQETDMMVRISLIRQRAKKLLEQQRR